MSQCGRCERDSSATAAQVTDTCMAPSVPSVLVHRHNFYQDQAVLCAMEAKPATSRPMVRIRSQGACLACALLPCPLPHQGPTCPDSIRQYHLSGDLHRRIHSMTILQQLDVRYSAVHSVHATSVKVLLNLRSLRSHLSRLTATSASLCGALLSACNLNLNSPQLEVIQFNEIQKAKA